MIAIIFKFFFPQNFLHFPSCPELHFGYGLFEAVLDNITKFWLPEQFSSFLSYRQIFPVVFSFFLAKKVLKNAPPPNKISCLLGGGGDNAL
jgi:hypothetical protein